MGGHNNVAGDYEKEMYCYNEAETGFLQYLLWTKFQLEVDHMKVVATRSTITY